MTRGKLRAIVVEPDPIEGKWEIVAMTKLFDYGWQCGLALITSPANIFEEADKENVPIITRRYIEDVYGVKSKK